MSGTGSGWTSFVVKLDTNGNFLWAASLGPDSEGYSVATDNQDNVVLTGNFSNTIDFDPQSGVQNITAIGNKDIYLLKLNPEGEFVFVKTWGSSGIDRAQSVLVDDNDQIYLSGYASGTVLDMDPGYGVEEISFTFPNESFLLKLSPFGDFIWARHLQGRNNHFGHSTSINAAGEIATSGYFNGVYDFDPGPGDATMSAVSSWDVYLQLFSADGEHLWVKTFGGNGLEWGMGIDFDQNGNLYLAGYYESDEVDFNPDDGTDFHSNAGWSDIFIQKYAFDSIDDVISEEESTDNPQAVALSMPNVISGNGDNINDFFAPLEIAEHILVKEVSIYNRWGNVVYSANSFDQPWDGASGGVQCAEGTYFWILKYEMDGNLNSSHGIVTLLN
jgi:gliding motility-associated-like protein